MAFSQFIKETANRSLKTFGLTLSGMSMETDSTTGKNTLYVTLDKGGKANYNGRKVADVMFKLSEADRVVLDGQVYEAA